MNTKHTPGPWSIGEPIQEQTTILSNDRFGTLICMIADSSDVSLSEQSANARLIAAAPELLAALEEAYALLCLISNHHGSILGRTICDTTECRKQARAAIAKATNL